VGVCTSCKDTATAAAEHGSFEFGTTNLQEILDRDDVHIINVCTPNNLHAEQVLAALRAGKHVYCDKPLTRTVEEAERVAAESAARPAQRCQVTFHYRFVPALMRARQLVDEGLLGQPVHYRAAYLHSGYTDPARPMSWRLDAEQSGGGALFDLGSHVLDTVRFLLGDAARVCATLRTFIPQRPAAKGSTQLVPVRVDDVAVMQMEMVNGACGLVEASRLATGANDQMRIEIHGLQGALAFDLEEPSWLRVYDTSVADEPLGGARGWRRTECVQRYDPPAKLPGPKFAPGWLRFHVHSLHEFVRSIIEGRHASPDFFDGLAVQRILDAAQRSSATGSWTEILSP